MNKENAHQFLPLVEALAAGKGIEIRDCLSGKWYDAPDDISFNSPHGAASYRVKPEPREWTITVHQDGSAEFDIGGLAAPRGETIRVREILD